VLPFARGKRSHHPFARHSLENRRRDGVGALPVLRGIRTQQRIQGIAATLDDEVRFLSQIRRYSVSLNDSDRKLVLAMIKKNGLEFGENSCQLSAISHQLSAKPFRYLR